MTRVFTLKTVSTDFQYLNTTNVFSIPDWKTLSITLGFRGHNRKSQSWPVKAYHLGTLPTWRTLSGIGFFTWNKTVLIWSVPYLWKSGYNPNTSRLIHRVDYLPYLRLGHSTCWGEHGGTRRHTGWSTTKQTSVSRVRTNRLWLWSMCNIHHNPGRTCLCS